MFSDERMLEELRLHKEKGLVKDCISRPYVSRHELILMPKSRMIKPRTANVHSEIRQKMKTEQSDKGWIADVKNQFNAELKF
ncbi:hypothetical protein BY996DRAFT_6453336 [Phakopsora pachyrhizi]|nr:hypothetical protein BY996DRAFT_6453336 [Phakopsora pachyrhizi]